MKRNLALLLICILLFTITGCGNSENKIDDYISSVVTTTNDRIEDNNTSEEIVENNANKVSNAEKDFPTIDEYISALKVNLNENSIGEGNITNGRYEFYLSEMVKVALVLNTNNEVVNASFLITGSLSNFADDVINTMGIGVSLMQPFCELCETGNFDTETVLKSIYQKINMEIEKNNYKPDFSVEYQFGECKFLMNSIDLGGSIQFMVTTGYKK